MSAEDRYSYTLQSCDNTTYPDITDVCTAVIASPYDGEIVYIDEAPYGGFGSISQERIYLVVANGLNATICNGMMPQLGTTVLTSCADTNKTKLYRLLNCANPEETREVLLAASQTVGNVLRFAGECNCWKISAIIANYDESPTIQSTFTNCRDCLKEVAVELCAYGERTIGYAVSPSFPKAEPQDRGFKECCYTNLVLADLSDTQAYRNDFTTVYYKRQTPNDTVVYQLIGVSTGTTTLVNGTHGVLYSYGGTEQPDLSYFRVEWRDALSALGEDTYTIRMVQTIAGVVNNVDSVVSYTLKQFTLKLADNTVRMDWTMDGTLTKENVNFKNTGYTNSVRTTGFFGDRTPNVEQDNLIYSNYYQGQITMSNSFSYVYQATNLPECVTRPIFVEAIFGNDIFMSDYNLNNHSYLYELLPVLLETASGIEYPVKARKASINLTFADRAKDNRKTNC